jgi:hypothetical protein
MRVLRIIYHRAIINAFVVGVYQKRLRRMGTSKHAHPYGVTIVGCGGDHCIAFRLTGKFTRLVLVLVTRMAQTFTFITELP